MPSERHINRQIQWRDTLRKYGANVSLERMIRIRGARVVVDVYAEIEGKISLIEIGNINDERKTALMSFYAESEQKVEFIHEPYGYDEIPKMLESLEAYRKTQEYKDFLAMKELTRQQKERRIEEANTLRQISLILGVLGFLTLVICLCLGYEFIGIAFWGTLALWIFAFSIWLSAKAKEGLPI